MWDKGDHHNSYNYNIHSDHNHKSFASFEQGEKPISPYFLQYIEERTKFSLVQRGTRVVH